MPRTAQLVGGFSLVRTEVEGRSAPPMRLVMTQWDPTCADPGSFIPPDTTPSCHSWKRARPSATRWVMKAHIAAGSAGSGSNPRSAPQVVHCLHAVLVDLVGAGRAGGLSGAGDPLQVLVGQSPAGLEWRSGQPRDHRREVGRVVLDDLPELGRGRTEGRRCVRGHWRFIASPSLGPVPEGAFNLPPPMKDGSCARSRRSAYIAPKARPRTIGSNGSQPTAASGMAR